MGGNKMIGTVLFLAFIAPLIAAQYPATTPYATEATYQENVYPETSYETTTAYESSYPESTTESSYPQPTSDESYPEAPAQLSYPETTYDPSYSEPTAEESYSEPASGESYPQPTSKPSYPEPNYPSPATEQSYPETRYPSSPTKESSYTEPTYETGSLNSETDGNEYNQDSNGPYNSQFNLLPNIPISAVRNIEQEVDNVRSSINSVLRHDRIQKTDLNIIERKINKATSFREGFEGTYKQLVASVDAQDRKIEKYRAQIDVLGSVSDDVRSLAVKVNLLNNEIRNIRSRNTASRAIIQQLNSSNGAQNFDIVAVVDQAGGNDELIEIINTTRRSNIVRNAAVVKELTQVVVKFNQEKAYSFIVTLCATNKSVHINYDVPFFRKPQLIWSINGIDIEQINNRSSNSGNNAYNTGINEYSSGSTGNNEYTSGSTGNNEYTSGSTGNNEYRSGSTGNNEYSSGSTGNNEYSSGSPGNDEYRSGSTGTNEYRPANYDESISPRVTVSGDANGVTVTLVDSSKGWGTEKVRVQVLAFDINNDRSSSEENRYYTPEGQYSTEEESYSTPKGGYSAKEESYSNPKEGYSAKEESYTTTEERYPRES